MRILVSGASGLIGSALVPSLETAGHGVTRLVRAQPRAGEILWDPGGALDPAALQAFDAVVHLAGESIAGRWTASKKSRIVNSRVQGTQALSVLLTRLARPPQVLVCASAVGYYGDRGDQVLTEDSPPGSGFLAETCQQWEKATEPAARAGIRVVNLRIGFVLEPRGGGLGKMLRPFRLGLGGRLGSGRQWMSWVAIDDVVAAIQHALATSTLRGPVNAVAPNPVTNSEFTRILGEVLHRPTIFPVPAFAVRLAFGEMGQELLLYSQRADPSRLRSSGCQFRHPELKPALEHLLRR